MTPALIAMNLPLSTRDLMAYMPSIVPAASTAKSIKRTEFMIHRSFDIGTNSHLSLTDPAEWPCFGCRRPNHADLRGMPLCSGFSPRCAAFEKRSGGLVALLISGYHYRLAGRTPPESIPQGDTLL
jgi:hypothetical protein